MRYSPCFTERFGSKLSFKYLCSIAVVSSSPAVRSVSSRLAYSRGFARNFMFITFDSGDVVPDWATVAEGEAATSEGLALL